MRRALSLGIGLALSLASAAGAQAPPADVHDVPAGPGRIEGRVLRTPGDVPLEGAQVVLYALSRSGVPGVRRAETGADGRFAFEGIANAPETAYLVGARYRGIPFPGERVAFEPGETLRRVEIRIAEPSPDLSGIEVLEVTLHVERVGDRLALSEAHRLRNPRETTAYVEAGARDAAQPGFRALLPEGAEAFTVPFGVMPEGLVRDGRELAFYGPFYPGEQELRFSYELPIRGSALQVEKRLPSGARRVKLELPSHGLEVKAPGLRDAGVVQVEGRALRRLEGDAIAPGGALRLRFELPPATQDPSLLHVTETRLFLELDDAVLLVREEIQLHVDGDAPLVTPAPALALPLPLPPEAEEVRFSTNALELGLVEDPSTGTGLRGPIPPGDSKIEVLYRLRVPEGGGLRFEKRFGTRVPLLSVFIADTGVLARSDRLHRRRPVRTPDRTFIHLEGFEIEPQEAVALELAPLHAQPGLPRGVRLALVTLVAAGLVWFLVGPLGRAREEPERAEAGAVDPARDEREAIYAALRDLEHDFEMGKLTQGDYESLRRELRGRAARLLRAEEQASAPAPPAVAETTAPRCGACGAEGREGDRFCARCGARLASAPEAAEAAS